MKEIYHPTIEQAINGGAISKEMAPYLGLFTDKEDQLIINRQDYLLAGNYEGAAILSALFIYQIIPKNDGTLRAIYKLGKLWSAYSYDQWEDLIFADKRKIARAVKVLAKKGIITKKQMIFRGKSILHISLNLEVYSGYLNKAFTEFTEMQYKTSSVYKEV